MPVSESYSPGYSDPVVAFMLRRTAATHAAFFVPLLAPGMRVLDCGCGPGSITLDLARLVRPGEVIGIDQEPAQFTAAIERASTEELPVTFRQASVYELPFESQTFDAVFAHGLLSHLSDPMRALLEMRRVLKPHGLMGVRDADWGGALSYPPDAVVEAGIRHLGQMVRTGGGDPEIGRRLGTMLREAGLVEIRVSASYEVFDPAFVARFFAPIAPGHQLSPGLFLAQPWCEALGKIDPKHWGK